MPKKDVAARWRGLIHEFRSSGESVAAFCAGRGLAKPTFYEWRRRLAARDAPAAFLPVQVAPAPGAASSGGVEVVLRGGRRLRLERGFDPAVLVAALSALEGAAC